MNGVDVRFFDRALRRANASEVRVTWPGNRRATAKLIQDISNMVSRRYGRNNTLYLTAHYVDLPVFGTRYLPAGGYRPFEDVRYYVPPYEYANIAPEDRAKGMKEGIRFEEDYSPRNPKVKIDHFNIVVVPDPAGGAGERNDCLFECIYDYFHGMLPPTLRCPAQLKKALKLDRYALVPVKMLPTVEKLYTIRITLTGDDAYARDSKGGGMEIVMKDNHYTLKEQPVLKKRMLWNWKDHTKETALVILEGNPMKELPAEKMIETLKGGQFTFRKSAELEGKRGKPLKEQWKIWDQECKDLKEHNVDMHRTPKYTDAAKREMMMLARDMKFEPLPPNQQQCIADAMMGGAIYAEKGFEGEVHGYDYNSFYPSLLPKHTFPNGEGKFHILKCKSKTADGRDYWQYGVYRLAKSLPNIGGCRFWRTTGKGEEPWYTHYDLQSYEEHTGKTPALAQDGKDNALIWTPKERIHGATIFKDFVDKWFVLKQENSERKKGDPHKLDAYKTILTSLWGAMCEQYRNTKVYKHGDSVDEIIIGAMSTGNGKITVTTRPSGHIFKGELPALGCFLLSLARYKLGQMLAKVCNKDCRVVRVHTDGFLLTKPLPAGATSKHLGGLKYEPEKSGMFRVNNACSVVRLAAECE